MSAGGRPKSLFRSASEYSCISPPRRLSGRGGLPWHGRLLGRLALLRFLVTSSIQARLEHFHQIDHVGSTFGGRGFCKGYFLAFHLALDRGLHPAPMLVDIF